VHYKIFKEAERSLNSISVFSKIVAIKEHLCHHHHHIIISLNFPLTFQKAENLYRVGNTSKTLFAFNMSQINSSRMDRAPQ